MQCEFCGSEPCQCDLDGNNPIDMRAEDWEKVYSNPNYDLDHDYSMNY